MRILVHWMVAIAGLLHLVEHAKSLPPRWGSVRSHSHSHSHSHSLSRGSGSGTRRKTPSVSRGPPLASLHAKGPHSDKAAQAPESSDNTGTGTGMDKGTGTGTGMDKGTDTGTGTSWTLEEDWALIDNLPLYTVSTNTEIKTFWTQLWSSNPLLFSTKQPEELHRRTLELQNQRDTSDVNGNANVNANGISTSRINGRASRSLVFGESPPILENWKLDLEQQDNRVVGQIGKRTIWFHYHSIGRLEEDPFADRSSSVVSLLPGGYIEAVGGRIYELGQPMPVEHWDRKNPGTIGSGNNSNSNSNSNNDNETVRRGESASSRWWLPGGTAVVSALVSSTILSACIGYGAGLSIVRDESLGLQQPTPTVLTVGTATPMAGSRLLPRSSSMAAATARSTSISTTTTASPGDSDSSLPSPTPSTEELRARAQYRVLREERLIKKISQRLEIDKQNLQKFEERQQQQQQQQQQSSGLHP